MCWPSPVRSRWSNAKPTAIAAAIPVADLRGDARIGRAHVVEAGLLAERSGLAGERDRAHDEPGVNGAQPVVAETRPRHHARREVLDQHVDLRHDRLDE